MVAVLFKILAKNPPSIAMAGGILIILLGNTDLGMQLFYWGVLLQLIWLFMRYLIKTK